MLFKYGKWRNKLFQRKQIPCKCSESNPFREIQKAERRGRCMFQENEFAIDQASSCLAPTTRGTNLSPVLHRVCSDSDSPLSLSYMARSTEVVALYPSFKLCSEYPEPGSSCLPSSIQLPEVVWLFPEEVLPVMTGDSCLGGGLNHNLDQSTGYLMWVLEKPICAGMGGRFSVREVGNRPWVSNFYFLTSTLRMSLRSNSDSGDKVERLVLRR